MTSSSLLRSVKAVLFDMDGVIYVGNRPLPGVQELLDYLDASGRKWLFVTNNASMTSQQFVDKVAAMNIRTRPPQILGSAEATAGWLRSQIAHHGWPEGKVLVLGMEGLRHALESAGFELTADHQQAAYAVAGANFNLVYNDLAEITLAIRRGARFVGTNMDPTYPTERGQIPGTGSLLALLTTASGVQPEIVGKPFPGMYQQAMERLDTEPASTLMIGDRYDTDIAGALKLGMVTAGVLTGISSRHEFETADAPPHFVIENLPDLLARFRAADAS